MSEAASFLRSSMIHGCPLRPHGVFSVKLNNGSSVWITQVRLNFLELSKILSKSTMVWSHHKLIHSLHHRNKGQKEIYPFVFWHISELVQLRKWFEVTQSTLTLLLLPDLSARLGFYGTVHEIYEKIWDLNLDNHERSTPPPPWAWTLSGLSLNYSQP